MPGLPPLRLPGRYLAQAVVVAADRARRAEWQASALARWLATRPRSDGFAIQPRDFRPSDPEAGRRILAGAYVLGGATLAVGPHGDPWDRPSPSRAFAEALHRFDWLPDLIAAGPDGAAEALRLTLDWRRVFGRWNGFSWAPEVMTARVFRLACAGPTLAARASDAETAQLACDLARQARGLLAAGGAGPAAERATAAAVAAAALPGLPGKRLLERALGALTRALPAAIAPDGGHASRQPQAALELLFDLQTLDEALVQRGIAAPDVVQRGIDNLAAAVRFFTMADGRLAAVHGGALLTRPYVAAARAQDELGDRPTPTERNGYHRIEGRTLQVLVDVAAPATGPWSVAACVQPLALEVLAGGRRLIDACAGRGIENASTVTIGERPSIGRRLSGFAADALGPRLVDAGMVVEAQRHEGPGAVWLELAHEGWLRRYGLLHQRRLYVDTEAGQLRGEDRLTPTARVQGPDGRHFVPYAIRFQLHPGVSALVSQDRRSAHLRVEGASGGWILRNDTLEIALEPSPRPGRPSQQLVLRGQRRADSGARVRWKLAPAVTRVDPPASAA